MLRRGGRLSSPAEWQTLLRLLHSRGCHQHGLVRSRHTAQGAARARVPSPFDGHTVDNSYADSLLADTSAEEGERQVVHAMYSAVTPSLRPHPRTLLAWSPSVAAGLGLPTRAEDVSQDLVGVLAGDQPFEGSNPIATNYCGHQFGSWAGQLGDGRAILLAELVRQGDGVRQQVQVKGAGRTPYSRFADGRAVLRSSVREFVASEAMAALGVPTTRALCLMATGEAVVRDQFYSGHVKHEPGAAVVRVSPSFLRFGSFELPMMLGDKELQGDLVQYTLRTHFRDVLEMECSDEDKCVEMFRRAVTANAETVAQWQSLGFTHGVLNTDNMSVLGLTIDYGPYGFMERYNPSFVPNMSDHHGRYSFSRQPEMVQWNCMRFGTALTQLAPVEALQEILHGFRDTFGRKYEGLYCKKLGFESWRGAEDSKMLTGLLELMRDFGTDFTNTFRSLSAVRAGTDYSVEATPLPDELMLVLEHAEVPAEDVDEWREWVHKYARRLEDGGVDDPARRERQNATNPNFIPRNYMLHAAIASASRGSLTELRRLCHVLDNPFAEAEDVDLSVVEPLEVDAAALLSDMVAKQEEALTAPLEPAEQEAAEAVAALMRSTDTHDVEVFRRPAPQWAGTAGVTQLSCSS